MKKEELSKISGYFNSLTATAEQRAEAFLRTRGLWEEGEIVTANLYPDDKTWEEAK